MLAEGRKPRKITSPTASVLVPLGLVAIDVDRERAIPIIPALRGARKAARANKRNVLLLIRGVPTIAKLR
jgi:hypothetical protein